MDSNLVIVCDWYWKHYIKRGKDKKEKEEQQVIFTPEKIDPLEQFRRNTIGTSGVRKSLLGDSPRPKFFKSAPAVLNMSSPGKRMNFRTTISFPSIKDSENSTS